MKKISFCLFLLPLTLLVGCTMTRRPAVDIIPDAEMALLEANQMQAPQYAPEELAAAKGSLVESQKALNQNLPDTARKFAEMALIDAKYAGVVAQSNRTRLYMAEHSKEIEKLSR